MALTYGEVCVTEGRQPSLVLVQEMLGFRHHAVAPQEEVGEYGVDHPESADTKLLKARGECAEKRMSAVKTIFKGVQIKNLK